MLNDREEGDVEEIIAPVKGKQLLILLCQRKQVSPFVFCGLLLLSST